MHTARFGSPAPGLITPESEPSDPWSTKVFTKTHRDGRVKSIDGSAKLVVVMVGLPARGKSYTTGKIAKYTNMHYATKVFNVGMRRRKAAGGVPAPDSALVRRDDVTEDGHVALVKSAADRIHDAAALNTAAPPIDQSAAFFDPDNEHAAQLRDRVAMETLDELLNYLLVDDGCVGIFDATNSTLKRRKMVLDHIRRRAGPDINVLFIENVCTDENLLKANMLLKLHGPDYKSVDPEKAWADFVERVKNYERSYDPIGEYERQNGISFIRVVNAGLEIEPFRVDDLLSRHVFQFLQSFHLSPRGCWLTRHGESVDNTIGKVGGDSDLSDAGRRYARALASFMHDQRREWELEQIKMEKAALLPPQPGDSTPPNPYIPHPAGRGFPGGGYAEPMTPPDERDYQLCCPPSARRFNVLTSEMKRTIQTAEGFRAPHWTVSHTDKLNPRKLPVDPYDQALTDFPTDKAEDDDSFFDRYPRPGGDVYVDAVDRAWSIILDIERTRDHCLIISHRSIVRVLMGYFCGLSRADVMAQDCPLGHVWRFVPRPYGLIKCTYAYVPDRDCFELKSSERVK